MMENLLDKVDKEATRFHPGNSTLLVFLVLIVIVALSSMIGNVLVVLASSAQGIDLQAFLKTVNENSPLKDRNFFRGINLIIHFMTFSISAILATYFFQQNKTFQYLKLHKRPLALNVLCALVFMTVAFPLAQLALWLNQQIDLPTWVDSLSASADGALKSILRMDSPGEMFFNLLVLAVFPAIGEELLFRGVVQQEFEKAISPVGAVWITAIIFSAVHLQFEGFIPRMLLGAMLGYLFIWTRNLWIPILGHLIFNANQVFIQYFFGGQLETEKTTAVEPSMYFIGLAALLILIGLGYFIYNYNRENQLQEEIAANTAVEKQETLD